MLKFGLGLGCGCSLGLGRVLVEVLVKYPQSTYHYFQAAAAGFGLLQVVVAQSRTVFVEIRQKNDQKDIMNKSTNQIPFKKKQYLIIGTSILS